MEGTENSLEEVRKALIKRNREAAELRATVSEATGGMSEQAIRLGQLVDTWFEDRGFRTEMEQLLGIDIIQLD